MFILLLIIFIIFLALFSFLSWACVYHLRQYAPSGFSVPNLITTTFVLITAVLLIFAVYFFLQIPR